MLVVRVQPVRVSDCYSKLRFWFLPVFQLVSSLPLALQADASQRACHTPAHYASDMQQARRRQARPRGGDGGLRPCMDDSDGMGVERGAGHSPAVFFCRKIWANPSEYMKYTNFQPYLEHIHSRFRSRIVTFHHRISCSSSHSFRNLLYRVRFLSLLNQLNQRPGSYSVL